MSKIRKKNQVFHFLTILTSLGCEFHLLRFYQIAISVLANHNIQLSTSLSNRIRDAILILRNLKFLKKNLSPRVINTMITHRVYGVRQINTSKQHTKTIFLGRWTLLRLLLADTTRAPTADRSAVWLRPLPTLALIHLIRSFIKCVFSPVGVSRQG